jgi:P-type Cu+ transporter
VAQLVEMGSDRCRPGVHGQAALLPRQRRRTVCRWASEHAVAAAITAFAAAEVGSLPQAAEFAALPGLGARGAVDGREVVIGRRRLLADRGMAVPDELAARSAAWERDGCTVVLAGWDGAARGLIAVADMIKPSAAAAVAGLRRLGLRTILLTGDNEATARAVAAQAGVDEVISGALCPSTPTAGRPTDTGSRCWSPC